LQAGAMDEAAERFGEVLALDSQDGVARRAREVAVKYQRRQRDSSFDSYASTLELREMDER